MSTKPQWRVMTREREYFVALYEGERVSRVHPLSFTDEREAQRGADRLNKALERSQE